MKSQLFTVWQPSIRSNSTLSSTLKIEPNLYHPTTSTLSLSLSLYTNTTYSFSAVSAQYLLQFFCSVCTVAATVFLPCLHSICYSSSVLSAQYLLQFFYSVCTVYATVLLQCLHSICYSYSAVSATVLLQFLAQLLTWRTCKVGEDVSLVLYVLCCEFL